MAVVVVVQMAERATGPSPADTSTLRLGAMVAAAGHALAQTTFAVWTRRQRLTIDALRGATAGRASRTGAWTVAWSLTFVVATLAATVAAGSLAAVGALPALSVVVGLVVGVAVVAVRVEMTRVLGADMARVVLGARRWWPARGAVTATADGLLLALLVIGGSGAEVDRTVFQVVAVLASIALVGVGLFQLAFMRRADGWIVEWWDQRHAPFDPTLHVVTGPAGRPGPTGPAGATASTVPLVAVWTLRYAVLIASWFAGATVLWAGVTAVWHGRSGSTDAGDGLGLVGGSVGPVILSLVFVQAAQAVWCVVQAVNARRCGLDAPAPVRTALLFVIAPAIAVCAMVFAPRWQVALVTLALIVNLGAWASSFSVVGRIMQQLGRSAYVVAVWSCVASLHWALGLLVRPITLIADDRARAALVALTVLDATVLVAVGIAGWRAMWGLDQAMRRHAAARHLTMPPNPA